MNVVIKRLMEWKQAPLDATVLAFNYLQKFYVHEIMRGLCNVGNYCLKQIHIGASADKGDLIFPTEICAPEKIIDLVRGKLAEETAKSVEDDKDSKLPQNAMDSEKDHPQQIYIEADDNTIPPCENTADERRKWTEYGKQMLTFQHKNDIISDKMLCSDIINFAQDILQQQFPNIQGYQHTGYAPVLKDEKWEYKLQMKSKKSPAAQIHHTGHSHWITSTQQ